MQRSIVCEAYAKFLSPFLSINHQCTKKHKARVFIIRYYIWEVGGFGGEASPPHPPVDETLRGGGGRSFPCALPLMKP